MREPNPMSKSQAAEPEAEVRAQAAWALGQYATAAVLQALIAGLDDTDLAVNRAALGSLRTLTGQDLGIDRGAWVAWVDSTAQPFAGRSLYYFPVYQRPRRLFEYIPFAPPPPNERTAPPAGMPLG
jgi:HEAT repeat protein